MIATHLVTAVFMVIALVCTAVALPPKKLSERYTFRNLKVEDIKEVSELCAECFEGPFNALQFFQKSQSTNEFKKQIGDRYANLVVEGKKHSMLVVSDLEDGEIIGFVECGLLPPPPVTKSSTPSADLKGALSNGEIATLQSEVAQAIQEASMEMEAAEAEAESGAEGKSKEDEVPYLGNVAVKEKARRQGIGRKLVQLSMKLAAKAGEQALYVIVDSSNDKALLMYKSLGFTCCLDERDLISRRRAPRVFLEKSLVD